MDEAGQVPLHVKTQGQKVGNNTNRLDASSGEPGYRPGEVGIAQFEESGLDVLESPRPRQIPGSLTDRLIRRLDPRAVGKNNDSCSHAP